MKKYFLAFDFYNKHINRFYHCVTLIDLDKTNIVDFAKEQIKNEFEDIDPESVTIKITSFNLV